MTIQDKGGIKMIENKPNIEECEELAGKMVDNMEFNDLVESYIYFQAKDLQTDVEQFQRMKKFYDEVEE